MFFNNSELEKKKMSGKNIKHLYILTWKKPGKEVEKPIFQFQLK